MTVAETSFVIGESAAILDRHAFRRTIGVPTVSLLVGPIEVGQRFWRRWSTSSGRDVLVSNQNRFPCAAWIQSVAERVNLPTAAIRHLALRGNRDPDEFLVAWEYKTLADRERFWSTLAPAPNEDDDLLRILAMLPTDSSSQITTGRTLSGVGERIVPVIVRILTFTIWPSVLFVSTSECDFSSVAHAAANWALLVPAVPIAIAANASDWDLYLATSPESRVKATLREGEFPLPVIEATVVERTLIEAGAGESAVTAISKIAVNGVDSALVEAAVAAIQNTAVSPESNADNDRARSCAERFLFEFLESLPETNGRFELNGTLDFNFGPRLAEVDFLSREPRIAIEIDGYFHFVDPAGYRRDRKKDWELQRRGFLVLRFLAEDVIPQLGSIRDRILEALAGASSGEIR